MRDMADQPGHPCPIFGRAYRRVVPTFTKILAATDFSDDSNYALGFAEELARRFGAEITVLHVDQPLAPVMVSELNPGFDFAPISRLRKNSVRWHWRS